MQVGEAVAKYLSLPFSEKNASQELTHFARWFGWERLIDSLSPAELEEYASRFPEKLETLRTFLSYLKKEKLTRLNLATHLRAKKPSTKTVPPAQSISLTPEGHKQLKEELEELKKERIRLVEAVSRAREDKDFRENAPFQAAKERLAFVDSRIMQIEKILEHTESPPTPKENLVIGPGSMVVLRELGSERLISCQLVHPQEANLFGGKISLSSPVGKALLGKKAGEQIEVKAPAGILRYWIEEIQ